MKVLKSNRSLSVTLTPRFSNHGEPYAISVRLGFTHPFIDATNSLLTITTHIASIPTGILQDDELTAFDDLGPLPVASSSETVPQVVNRKWKASRQVIGPVHAFYTALPRLVSSVTKNGPAIDLRKNSDGLLGPGYAFLAIPEDFPGRPYNINVKWDFRLPPPGTSAVPARVQSTMPASSLQGTYFALGHPLFTLEYPLSITSTKSFAMHWLGRPPFDVAALSHQLKSSFHAFCLFFEDSIPDTYRVFIRRNLYFGSRTSTALERCFMFSYDDFDDFADPKALSSLASVLAHEMVHNWATLTENDPKCPMNWYSEDMAEYYSVLLPYRFAMSSTDDTERFVADVNAKLLAYYTNPLVDLSNEEVAELTWEDSHAQRLPYGRGFAYALKTNALIVEKSCGNRSLDDISLELVRMARRLGKLPGYSAYMQLLEKELGKIEAEALFKSMAAGELVVATGLPASNLPYKLQRQDQARFELGFDESAIIEGGQVVTNLAENSRAYKAGLRDGDTKF